MSLPPADVPSEPLHVVETRTAYDAVAVDYARLLEDELARSPLDRALLGHFAELVWLDGGGPVVDVGCGPGRITGHLATLRLDVSGIDLSPGMVAEAQRRHPDLAFRAGSLAALDLADASVAGVVAWYSVIHTPPALLPDVFSELHRVIRPNGLLLLAFQAGGFSVRHEQAYGHEVTFEAHRLDPDHVAGQLADAGFRVTVRTERAAQDHEKTPQAFLLARREGASDASDARAPRSLSNVRKESRAPAVVAPDVPIPGTDRRGAQRARDLERQGHRRE